MPRKVSKCFSPQDTTFLTEYNNADQRWDFNKSANNVVSDFYQKSGYEKYAQRTDNCATRLGMKLRTDCEGNQVLKLQSVFLCHVRLCPICQACRNQVWKNRINKSLPMLIEQQPNIHFIFLTLTVKNCPVEQLRSTLLGMTKAFNNLMKRARIQKVVTGYIKSTEVTKSQDFQAHPHFHVLLAVKPSYFSYDYIKQEDWVELWQECLKVNYRPVVDIRKVREKNVIKDKEQLLKNAVKETAKYMVKPMDMIGKGHKPDREFFIELTNQLHGIKATNLSGIFKEYLKTSEPTEDEILEANLEDIEKYSQGELDLGFSWLRQHKKYGYHRKT